ncbi:MAG: tRNA pseudouridine(55) synthase TruB, partial [Firmicutes bacterium]|nr:tRNA pseudouridine(55) synthase TruB [Bacillota bacterium]
GKVKKTLHAKAGHMGTLDPMATGVLLVGVGQATRLFDLFLGHDKTYIAEFEFGYCTDTLDALGTLVEQCDKIPNEQQIQACLPSLCGQIGQIPPQYSAKSVGGKRAYQIARAGGSVVLPPKQVTIYGIKYLGSQAPNKHSFEIRCSSGTYIRSICRDMAARLGSLATMTALVRVQSGDYALQQANDFEDTSQWQLIPLETVLHKMPRVDIDEKHFEKLANGVKLNIEPTLFAQKEPTVLLPEVDHTVYCRNTLFGIGRAKKEKLVIGTNLFTR